MNPVDNYLDCLHEGEKWDKVKAFAKKHKGKIIAGTGAALAAGALARGKTLYDRSPAGQAKKAAEFEAARKKKEADDKLVDKYKKQDASKKDFYNKVGATASAAGAVVDTVTKPLQWAAKKGLNAVYSGAKAGTKYVGKKAQEKIVDAANRHRLRDRLN
jgi:hypothetical protein